MRLRFSRPPGLLVAAAVAVAAGCRHAAPSPAGWADAVATADVAFVVGECALESARPAARVQLLDSSGAPRDSASTDGTGAFLLGPVPPGAYRLQTRAILHRPLARSLTLRGGAVDTVRLRLTFDDAGAIIDCVGPERLDGSRGFGSQFCRP